MTLSSTDSRSPLAKSFAIYVVAFAIAGATPFILLPFMTRHLSPREFGGAAYFIILTAIIGNVAGLSTPAFVSVRFAKFSRLKFPGVVSSSALAVVATHAAVVICITALHYFNSSSTELSLGLSALAVLAALFLSWNLIFLAIFQSAREPMYYLKARLTQACLEIVLCIAIVILIAATAEARIFSYGIALGASCVIGLRYCVTNKYLPARITKSDLRNMAAFGLPMLPHIVAGTAISNMDRALVSSILGLDELGIYMVAMQIGMAMIFVVDPLNRALAPWLYEQLAKNDATIRRMIVKNTYYMYAAIWLLAALWTLVSVYFFSRVIGSEYAAAQTLIPWMVAGFTFQGMYYSVVNYIFYAEKSGSLSLATTLIAIGGCALSYLLISYLGLVGACISFALNNLLLFMLVWVVASRSVSMPWRLRKSKYD